MSRDRWERIPAKGRTVYWRRYLPDGSYLAVTGDEAGGLALEPLRARPRPQQARQPVPAQRRRVGGGNVQAARARADRYADELDR